MDSKKSLIIFAVGLVWGAAVVWGFAHGSEQEETVPKIAWVVGSLVFAALGCFLSYKSWKKK